MESFTPLTVLCSVVCLAYAARGIFIIGRVRWIPITVLLGAMVALRCGVAIPFQSLFENVVDFSTVAMERAAIAMLIFATVGAVAQEFVYRSFRRRKSKGVTSLLNVNVLVGCAIFFWGLAMLGHVYFLFIKRNIDFLPTALGSFANPDDHYAYRAYFGKLVYNARVGQWVSYLSLFILTPIALVLLGAAYHLRNSLLLAVLAIFLVGIAPVAAIIHGQRSILVILAVISLLSGALALKGNKLQELLLDKRVFLYGSAFFVGINLLGGVIYSITNRTAFGESMTMMIVRVFVVPAVTPNFIYELFPEQFDYRGLAGCFKMLDRLAETSDITFGDLAMALQGVSSNANSTFIAVGYSGLGFFGVFLISVVTLAMAVSLDRLLQEESTVVRLVVLFVSLDPIQALTSDHLHTGVFSRGYFVSALVLIACFRVATLRAAKCVAVQRAEGVPTIGEMQ
jgi:hypothetical protein